MILHPDGRFEGTPEELQRFEELRKAAPKTVPLMPVGPMWPNPHRDVTPLPYPSPVGPTYGSGDATYRPNPNIVAMN